VLALAVLAAGPALSAEAPVARQCLSAAAAAADQISLPGDQSAARRDIAILLAGLDPQAASGLAGRITRPADAARALGAVAAAEAGAAPSQAGESAAAAGRLLLRLAEPVRRAAEQRFLLAEAATLEEKALPAAPELPAEEAKAAVVRSLARRQPAAALKLLDTWKLTGEAADLALAEIAAWLSESDPEEALRQAARIAERSLRNATAWRIAERRPPGEAAAISHQIDDLVVRSGALASAAVRQAAENPPVAEATAAMIPVAHDSALAQLAAALADRDYERALGLARAIRERPRSWALAQIASGEAVEHPERCEAALSEAKIAPDVARVILARMAPADPERAARLAQALPEGEGRAAAVAAVAAAIASLHPEQAGDLLWTIDSPRWQARAAGELARQLARTDWDAATAVLGLVSDQLESQRLRGEVAAVVAPRDPDQGRRMLELLPDSYWRGLAGMEAALGMVAAGRDSQAALPFASLAAKQDLALRWLVPQLSLPQVESPISAAERIGDPYLRSLALADAARVLTGESRCRPAPDRARQVRPIYEWEGE
jgi:hypothetical protein